MAEKTTERKEAEISMTEALRDACCVIRYLHVVTSLLSGTVPKRKCEAASATVTRV